MTRERRTGIDRDDVDFTAADLERMEDGEVLGAFIDTARGLGRLDAHAERMNRKAGSFTTRLRARAPLLGSPFDMDPDELLEEVQALRDRHDRVARELEERLGDGTDPDTGAMYQ